MKKITVFFIMCCVVFTTIAQKKATISGTVRDAQSGETLIGITVFAKEIISAGCLTNEYGYYSLSLPIGNYTLVVSSTGYETITRYVTCESNQTISFNLVEASYELDEVTITTERADRNVTQAQTGVQQIKVKEISLIPVIFGERDILKALQLLPGVKSVGEGSSGFTVRGGAADQNLILLDEAPVYNASHLMGFFSTFNSDAIKDATIYKGNYAAQYGGRLASVVDVKMNEGNNQSYHTSGSLGLISSNLTLEGPIQKEKSSFLIAARRTYADVFLNFSETFKGNTMYFYDLNVKGNYEINSNNRIYLSGYFGRDVQRLKDLFGMNWGNKTATLRWNSIISPKLFSNTTFVYSDYDYKINLAMGSSPFNINSLIRDFNLKQEFQYYINPTNRLRMGFNTIHHTIIPYTFEGKEVPLYESLTSRMAWENAAYVSHLYSPNAYINLEYGLRLSTYSILGSGSIYNHFDQGQLIGITELKKGEFGKTYFTPEPRFSGSFILTPESSIKAAYNYNAQYIHLLSNSTASSPTDQWVGSSYTIRPETGHQVSLGYFRNFDDNRYEFNAEIYYKAMKNVVDYKDGADLYGVADPESELLFGNGRAYGLEVLLKKKTGALSGWISYTLSRTERKIDGINESRWYAAKQDRTHDVSIVGMYAINKKWNVSATWVYYTGNAVTFPSGKYNVDGEVIMLYTDRNAYRMPAYHRLDVGATYTRKMKRYESSWNFSLYNAYGRENAFMIGFEDVPNDPTRTQAVQFSLFRWIPSVSYNFKF